ncbi:MAG: hypothetical protein ACRDQZ_16515, partial [Mycobacteriales bacterium]
MKAAYLSSPGRASMHTLRGLLLPMFAGALCGCVTSQTVTGVPMDEVINQLKERLNTVGPVVVSYSAEKGCMSSGEYAIVAFPTKTQVQLKTVLTHTNTAGIGGQFGTPIVVTPSAQRVASRVKTAQTTVNFCALPENLDATDGTPPNGDCLWTLKNPKAGYVHALWPTRTKTFTVSKAARPAPPVTVKASDQPPVTDLADALNAAIGGLVQSEHRDACLLPQTLDVQLAFEASVDTSAGLKLSLVFVNIQDTQDFKRDYT